MSPWRALLGASMTVTLLAFVGACSVSGDGSAGPSTNREETPHRITPDSWAGDFCGSMRDVAQDLDKEKASFDENLKKVSGIGDVKRITVRFIDRLGGRFKQVRKLLEPTAMPDVEGAKALRDKLAPLFDTYLAKLEAAQKRLEAVPEDDPKAFVAAAEEAGAAISLNSLGGSVTGDDPDLKIDPALRRALKDHCANLGG